MDSRIVEAPITEAVGYEPTINKEVVVRIRPNSGWASLKLGELWRYRELLYFFVWRDLKVRYKQTILGAAWAILQPFLTMVVFSVFFGRLAQVPSDDLPYPVFAYAALVPWTFFANGLTQATNSVVSNAGMVKKTYFPRLTLPVATVMAGLVDFTLALAVLITMMFFYQIVPTGNIVWLPLLLLLALVTSLGASLWFAALNVRFRDVRYIVPFLVQSWLFLTPIAYSSSIVPEQWKIIYSLNPMVGVVEGFRWALLGTDTTPGPIIIVSSLVALFLLISGTIYFRRTERSFADIV
ncbi:MAG: ABC transporter permease [Ardenticatenaceae bacterium]|nr:ABC transporter permease [Ardenticatenaceae bacterium]